MADHNDPTARPLAAVADKTLLIVAALFGVVVLFGALIFGLLVALPASSNPASVVVILLGTMGTTVTALVSALIGSRNTVKLDQVLNGGMDASMQRNIGGQLAAQDQRTVKIAASVESARSDQADVATADRQRHADAAAAAELATHGDGG